MIKAPYVEWTYLQMGLAALLIVASGLHHFADPLKPESRAKKMALSH